MQYGLLAATTLLAAALRFYKIGVWSFWIDEIFTIDRTIFNFNNLFDVIRNLPATRWLPASVILTNLSIKIFGISEWSARLPSALIGIASIPILYFLIKRMFGTGVASISVLLMSISPWHLFWSQNARYYMSLMVFSVAACMALFYGIEKDRPKYFILFYAFLYLAMSERFIAIIILPIVLLYVVILYVFPFEKPPGLRRKNLLILAAPLILVGGFEIVQFMSTGSSVTSHLLELFTGYSNHSPFRLASAIVYQVGIPLICLGFMGGVYLVLHRNREGLFVLLGAAIPPLLLILFSPFMFTVDRYAFVSLPFWIILGAVAVEELFKQASGIRKLFPLAVLLLLLGTYLSQDFLYYQYQNGNRTNWKSAYTIVSNKRIEGDLVLSTRPEIGNYYMGGGVIPINNYYPITITRPNQRMWFIIDEESGWIEPAIYRWIQDNASLIEVVEVQIPGRSLNTRVYLFSP